MKYSSRGDLFIAAGESIKMQEKAGIIPVCRIKKSIEPLSTVWFILDSSNYEFPLAVIEDKPVFVRDELYNYLGEKFVVRDTDMFRTPSSCTWLPPEPKTVMVELRIDVAERMAHDEAMVSEHLAMACRKALAELGE